MSGGGDSQPATQQVTSTNTTNNIPEYAQPYFMDILNRAQAESNRPYTPYEGQRSAGFTADQQDVQEQIRNLGTPGQFGAATGLSLAAGLGSLGAGQYTPTAVAADYIRQPNISGTSMGGVADVNYTPVAGVRDMAVARTGYNPTLQNYSMGAVQNVSLPNQRLDPYLINQQMKVQYDPNLQNINMGPAAEFGDAQAKQYMSPYIQNVLDVQKREAITDAKKAQLMTNLGAARQGTYGGARQLLAGTERERALGQQLGDIQARGLQSAYENAQAQFERDRAAGMTVGQANQQADLSVQQQRTQAGLQIAMANLSSEQQRAVQNQAAQLQTQGMSYEAAMKAALANQQKDLAVEQANLRSKQDTQQLQTQTGLQAALANLSAEQQANVQNQQAALQTQGLNAEQAMRAALANQQMGFNVGQANLQAGLQTEQLRTQAGLQAAMANQQAALDAQRLSEQSRQFANQQELAGYGQALESGRSLANIGLTQQQADTQRLSLQGAAADQYQQERQAQLDRDYADFLRQRDYPMEQLGYYSNLMRGIPVGLNSTNTTYAPPPSGLAQVAGAGLGIAGLSNMAGYGRV